MVNVIQIGPMGFDNNYSYLVYGSNKHALLIDATGSSNAIEKEIREYGLTLVAQVVTHAHFDHVEQVGHFNEKGAPIITFEKLKKEPGFKIDDFVVKTIFTPGHAPDSVCFLIENNLFTGDTLFVKGTGRTDLGGGSESQLEESIQKISSFSQDLKVWPGHNYGGSSSTLKEALENSGFTPDKELLKKIDEKKVDYEKQFEGKNPEDLF